MIPRCLAAAGQLEGVGCAEAEWEERIEKPDKPAAQGLSGEELIRGEDQAL
jgi:hypothetical protein